MNRLALLLLILSLPALGGCFAQAGPAPSASARNEVYREFVRIDAIPSQDELKTEINSLNTKLDSLANTQDFARQTEAVKMRLALAYSWERLGDLEQAVNQYATIVPPGGFGCRPAPGREYEAYGLFRAALVSHYLAERYAHDSRDPDLSPEDRQEAAERLKLARKKSVSALERCSNYAIPALDPLTGKPLLIGLMRSPEVAPLGPATAWESIDLRHEAYRRLDVHYRGTLSYRVFETIVRICGGLHRSSSYALALVLLAVLAKLITTPLSLTQFRSLRAMQAVQPELKKIQEKYKNDKQQLAKAQMALFKEHGVNPASSCLPMLIQLPILMWVYWGIRHFTYQFMGKPFLYLPSLGDPDVIHISGALWPGPMLLVYGLSMYFSQKLIATPAATPEQQQQQKLMAYMMPILFILIMKGLPAAFIFYWLVMNTLMTGHQYLIMRPQRAAAAAAEATAERPGPPPPQAIQKLSEGTKPRPKKKRRR